MSQEKGVASAKALRHELSVLKEPRDSLCGWRAVNKRQSRGCLDFILIELGGVGVFQVGTGHDWLCIFRRSLSLVWEKVRLVFLATWWTRFLTNALAET